MTCDYQVYGVSDISSLLRVLHQPDTLEYKEVYPSVWFRGRIGIFWYHWRKMCISDNLWSWDCTFHRGFHQEIPSNRKKGGTTCLGWLMRNQMTASVIVSIDILSAETQACIHYLKLCTASVHQSLRCTCQSIWPQAPYYTNTWLPVVDPTINSNPPFTLLWLSNYFCHKLSRWDKVMAVKKNNRVTPNM